MATSYRKLGFEDLPMEIKVKIVSMVTEATVSTVKLFEPRSIKQGSCGASPGTQWKPESVTYHGVFADASIRSLLHVSKEISYVTQHVAYSNVQLVCCACGYRRGSKEPNLYSCVYTPNPWKLGNRTRNMIRTVFLNFLTCQLDLKIFPNLEYVLYAFADGMSMPARVPGGVPLRTAMGLDGMLSNPQCEEIIRSDIKAWLPGGNYHAICAEDAKQVFQMNYLDKRGSTKDIGLMASIYVGPWNATNKYIRPCTGLEMIRYDTLDSIINPIEPHCSQLDHQSFPQDSPVYCVKGGKDLDHLKLLYCSRRLAAGVRTKRDILERGKNETQARFFGWGRFHHDEDDVGADVPLLGNGDIGNW